MNTVPLDGFLLLFKWPMRWQRRWTQFCFVRFWHQVVFNYMMKLKRLKEMHTENVQFSGSKTCREIWQLRCHINRILSECDLYTHVWPWCDLSVLDMHACDVPAASTRDSSSCGGRVVAIWSLDDLRGVSHLFLGKTVLRTLACWTGIHFNLRVLIFFGGWTTQSAFRESQLATSVFSHYVHNMYVCIYVYTFITCTCMYKDLSWEIQTAFVPCF